MEKNNTPRFSICRKIRQALATNPTFQAIHRIKQYKVKTQQGEGEIPIKFDYSTPKSKKIHNGSSKVSMIQGQESRVASPQVGTSEAKSKVAAKVVEPLPPQHVPRQGTHGVGMQNIEHQGNKKSLDFNDTIDEYIQRAKHRIRTASNVGRGQSNSVPDEANYGYGDGNGGSTTTTTTNLNRMEVHRDQFQDFIEKTKKKIRTTSNVGKTNSLKRG